MSKMEGVMPAVTPEDIKNSKTPEETSREKELQQKKEELLNRKKEIDKEKAGLTEEKEKLVEKNETLEAEVAANNKELRKIERAKLTDIEKTDLKKILDASKIKPESIPGFEELSYGERLLMLEMMQNEALKQVKDGARERFESKNKKSWTGFLPVRVIRQGFKNFNVAKEEKAAFEQLREKGIEKDRMLSIKTQIDSLFETGISVSGTKEGAYTINFAKAEEGNTANKEAYVAFNKAATEFSKIPDEWGAEYATAKEKKSLR